jgi:hypothetical protein
MIADYDTICNHFLIAQDWVEELGHSEELERIRKRNWGDWVSS